MLYLPLLPRYHISCFSDALLVQRSQNSQLTREDEVAARRVWLLLLLIPVKDLGMGGGGAAAAAGVGGGGEGKG